VTLKEKISPLEWIVQGLILCSATISVGLVTRWWILGKSVPGDFVICYLAAHGIFDPIPWGNVWMWKSEIAWLFIPFTWTDIFRAYWIWCGLQTLSFMFLAHKMMEVRFGWILVILVLPNFESLLKVGNIQIILTLAAIYPIPALLAVLVKPHHAVFAVLVAFARRYREIKQDRKRVHKT
jgi:hypothetical protein